VSKDNVALNLEENKQPVVLPTLVIGLGRFGHQVGVQLAERLQLIEADLRQDGQKSSLLMQLDDQQRLSPGLVRIMDLNWDEWMQSNHDRKQFLKDIDLVTPVPRALGREDERNALDWGDAKSALKKMREHILAISRPFRQHDNYMNTRNNRPLQNDQQFQMRICVICAAREDASAKLTADFVELLGNIFVVQTRLANSIEVICYVGSTTREEHIEAKGNDDEYDRYLSAELDRLLPEGQASLLYRLENMCRRTQYQLLHRCYVIDTQMQNGMMAVQGQANEPDEVVIASSLALNMFITANADTFIRQKHGLHWHLGDAYYEPGIFATFGIATYCIDHPKLRRLVYNRVLGQFLSLAQPKTEGEKAAQAGALNIQDEAIADNPLLEAQVMSDVRQKLDEYRNQLQFKAIEQSVPHLTVKTSEIDYYQAAIMFQQCDPDRQSIRTTLDKLASKWGYDTNSSELMLRLQQRQKLILDHLQTVFTQHLQEFYTREQAPLTRLHRFLRGSLRLIEQEASQAGAALTLHKMKQQQDLLIQEQDEQYQRTVGEIVTRLSTILSRQPVLTRTSGKIAFTVGTLLLVGLALTVPWVGVPTLAATTALFVFTTNRERPHNRIHKPLKQLEQKYFTVLQAIDQEAWKGALAELYLWVNDQVTQRITPLCASQGIISTLRDQFLADETIIQDQILERVFFNERLLQDLQGFSQQLAESRILWDRRQQLLQEIIERQPIDQHKIGDWLHRQVASVYRNDAQLITHLVNRFLENQTTQRIEDIWHTLSSVAVPFLLYHPYSQDDAGLTVELFSAYGLQGFEELQTLARSSQVEVIESVDQTRWAFMRIHTGLKIEHLTVFAASLV
jgi:hypothetical protein